MACHARPAPFDGQPVPYHREADALFYVGDARAVLRTLPDESVHCCVTSPPYWGLRDYGLEPQVWGEDPACQHAWDQEVVPATNGLVNNDMQGNTLNATSATRRPRLSETCSRCGAYRGSLGLEPSPDLYVQHLVEAFREVKRVLRRDGTLWLNLGDSYAAAQGGRQAAAGELPRDGRARFPQGKPRQRPGVDVASWSTRDVGGRTVPPASSGLKPKDLVGIPWRAAFALQADGWYLRSDVIWDKPNPMPESVKDRPTRAHEYLFLLARSARYYYDAEAIKEPVTGTAHSRGNGVHPKALTVLADWAAGPGSHPPIAPRRSRQNPAFAHAIRDLVGARNRRSVWTIATEPFPGAHFATFATRLVEPCILAGTSARGCCARCDAPFVRQTAVSYANPGHRQTNGPRSLERRQESPGFPVRLERRTRTVGWRASCRCAATAPVPCMVLDPFAGAGTTALVARRLGRHSISIDLNRHYADMANRRLHSQATKPAAA